MTSCAGPGQINVGNPVGQDRWMKPARGPEYGAEGDDWDAKNGKEDRMSLVLVRPSQL